MRELNPVQWAVLPLKKYADFSGRAPRAEYWWYALATLLLGLGLTFADNATGLPKIGENGALSLVFTLVTLVPGLAVSVRRLHDIDRTGWWALLNGWSYLFIVLSLLGISIEELMKGQMGLPIAAVIVVGMLVCGITMLVFDITQGTEGSNQYGPDPYGPGKLEEVFA